MRRLQDKVAFVTGGIGAATARRLAEEGARVAVLDLAAEGVAETARAIASTGGEALSLVGDVSNEGSVTDLVNQTKEHFGRIDILINNAGINRDALAARLTEEQWDQVLNVNLKAAFLCAQAVQPIMREQNDGRIVNTASIARWATWARQTMRLPRPASSASRGPSPWSGRATASA